MNIIRLTETDSTNEYLRRNLNEFDDRTVVVADTQTGGKGTYGRSFFSPKGGLYLSVLFKPVKQDVFPYLTPLVAVAVSRSVDRVFHEHTEIKWVNDVLVGGKKICGILCEKTGENVIAGIGVNLFKPEGGFPEELKNKAGFLSGDHVSYELKEKFLRELLDNLFFLYENFDKNDVISVYKEKSYVIGKNVKIIRGEEVVFGTVSDVTEEGELVLDTDLGKRVFLSGTLEVL